MAGELFPEDGPDSEDSIFGHRNSSASRGHETHDNHDATSQVVGDGLSNMSDRSIMRLVSLKFNNNPMELIRQLSKDVAQKEAELILLRKEKFQRERELLRLCCRYGNLSTVEVEQKLKALPCDSNVNDIVVDLVSSAAATSPSVTRAVDDSMGSKALDGSHQNVTKLVDSPHNKDVASAGSTTYTKYIDASSSENNTTPGYGHETHVPVPRIQAQVSKKPTKSWLSWLTPTEPSPSVKPGSISDSVEQKQITPVELKTITSDEDSHLSLSDDPTTDKFGFYNMPERSIKRDRTLSKADKDSTQSCSSTTSKCSAASAKDLSISGIVTVNSSSTSEEQKFDYIDALTESMQKLKELSHQYDVNTDRNLTKWDSFMTAVRKSNPPRTTEDNDIFGFRAWHLKQSPRGISKYFRDAEQDSKELKELRCLIYDGGIPAKYRNYLWYELTGANLKAVPGEYDRLLRLSNESNDFEIKKNIEQITLDLHRTYSMNKFFFNEGKPGPHFTKLQDILYAFVAYKPEIGYSQGMNKIVGNIILAVYEGNQSGSLILNEENMFWVFVSLVEEFLPIYHEHTFFSKPALIFIQEDVSLTANVHLKNFLPNLHNHLSKLRVEIEVIILSWWLGLFTEAVPTVNSWFTLFDGLLLAPSATDRFMGYTLAIFSSLERNLLIVEEAGDIYGIINRIKKGSVASLRFHDLISASHAIETRTLARKTEK